MSISVTSSPYQILGHIGTYPVIVQSSTPACLNSPENDILPTTLPPSSGSYLTHRIRTYLLSFNVIPLLSSALYVFYLNVFARFLLTLRY